MGRVLSGLCGLAAGVLIGLGVAWASSSSLRKARAQLDELKGVEEKLGAVRQGRDEAISRLIEVEKTQQLGDKQHQLELEIAQRQFAGATKGGEELAGHWLKSQAVLYMVLETDSMVELLRSAHFRSNYRADWYDPELCFTMIGAEWFAQDLKAQGFDVPLPTRRPTMSYEPEW